MSRWLFKTIPELKAEEAERKEKAFDRELRRECKYYSQLIPDVLANMGIDHLLPKSERPGIVAEKLLGANPGRKKLHIVETRYNEHAIYLWVETRNMPYRTMLPDLYSEAVLETLSDACGRQVAWRSKPGYGSWYVVWRDGAINAIPTIFKWDQAYEAIPDSAPPLFYVAGIGENNRLEKIDLAVMPHLLVAGSTFSGKSVHINSLVCQWLKRNTPEGLRLLMIDLKGGTEFQMFQSLPHLIRPIVKRPEEVAEALSDFQAEMLRRQELFTQKGVINISGWNASFPKEKLPYWVLIFDEFAMLVSHPDKKPIRESEKILAGLMATSRSTGGHVIIATQRPSADIVAPWIKANATGRICFAVPGNHDSINVIDNGVASKIDPSIKGRAIMSAGAILSEIQSPFISEEHVRQIVKEAGTYLVSAIKRTTQITIDDVLIEALDNYKGKLHSKKLFNSFRGRLGQRALEKMIRELPAGIVEIRGKRYQVIKGGRGWKGGYRIAPEFPEEDQEPPLRFIAAKRIIPHSLLKSQSYSRRNGNKEFQHIPEIELVPSITTSID